MAYKLSWYIAEQVLYVCLDSHSTLKELECLNQEITNLLEERDHKIHLLLDATRLKPDYSTSWQLRDTQHYIYHANVSGLTVIVEDKLARLVTLIAFCLSRAPFLQVESFDKATAHLKLRRL